MTTKALVTGGTTLCVRGPGEPRSSPDEPPRRRRTKADYLDTALVLANKAANLGVTPYAYAVAHVDMARVAEAAGVSRTALYRLWETQESFRADLAGYLAGLDDAPRLDLARPRLDAHQQQLSLDPRPLLRAGIAGYPGAGPVTAVIGEREQRRVAQLAELVDSTLGRTGRRCLPGMGPTDISVAANALADGLALAARMTPPDLPLLVEDEGGRPWSLLAAGVCALVEGMSEPDSRPATAGPTSGHPSPPPEVGPAPPAVVDLRGPAGSMPAGPTSTGRPPTGRRLHYLRLAARLASDEPEADAPLGCGALGYLTLDAVARAEGVTRAAVRKLWPTQGAFGVDLCGHLLARHRATVVASLHQGTAPAAGGRGGQEVLLEVGDALFDGISHQRAQVSHLTFAPQFVLPTLRTSMHRSNRQLLDHTGTALTALLSALGRRPRPGLDPPRLAVLVLAFVDGATRVTRTLPDLVPSQITHRRGRHSLVAIAFEKLVLGLSETVGPAGRTTPAVDETNES